MSSRNLGAAVLVLAAGLGVWFYYFGRAGRDAPVAPAAPPAVAVAPVAPEMPSAPATPPKPAEPPAPPKPAGPWDEAGVSQAVWEYNRAVEKEMAGWDVADGGLGPVVRLLTVLAKFPPEDLAMMEKITGILFTDKMSVKDWLTAVAAANKLPGTLEDWNSEPCRKVRDPKHNLGIAITGVWPQVANLVAAGYTGLTGKEGRTVSADAGFRAICEFATQQDGFR